LRRKRHIRSRNKSVVIEKNEGQKRKRRVGTKEKGAPRSAGKSQKKTEQKRTILNAQRERSFAEGPWVSRKRIKGLLGDLKPRKPLFHIEKKKKRSEKGKHQEGGGIRPSAISS